MQLLACRSFHLDFFRNTRREFQPNFTKVINGHGSMQRVILYHEGVAISQPIRFFESIFVTLDARGMFFISFVVGVILIGMVIFI